MSGKQTSPELKIYPSWFKKPNFELDIINEVIFTDDNQPTQGSAAWGQLVASPGIQM